MQFAAITVLVLWSLGVYGLLIVQIWRAHRVPTGWSTVRLVVRVVGTMYLMAAPMAVAAIVEQRSFAELLGPRQAGALRFGDLMLVPFMAGICALVWQRLPRGRRWYFHGSPHIGAVVAGAVLTLWFRSHDQAVYDPRRFWSLGKLAHDACNFPVIAMFVGFALITLLAALLTHVDARTVYLALLLMAALVAFGALLTQSFTGLNPNFLHVPDFWDPWPHRALCLALSR